MKSLGPNGDTTRNARRYHVYVERRVVEIVWICPPKCLDAGQRQKKTTERRRPKQKKAPALGRLGALMRRVDSTTWMAVMLAATFDLMVIWDCFLG